MKKIGFLVIVTVLFAANFASAQSGDEKIDKLIEEFAKDDKFLERDKNLKKPGAAATKFDSAKIMLNRGWKAVVLGASRSEIITALGQPSSERMDRGEMKPILIYSEKGIVVWLKEGNDGKAVKILFFDDVEPNNHANVEQFTFFGGKDLVKPKGGIFSPEKTAWCSSLVETVAAYGKPDSQTKIDEFGVAVTLMKYGETNFYFRDEKLFKIALISRDY